MLTNFIPQIGGFLGGSFFVPLTLTDGPRPAVIAGGIFLAYQQFENNVIQPAIVGSAVNLTPPTTMLAAIIGGAAAGVPGALVATPLIGAAKAVYLVRKGELPLRRDSGLAHRVTGRLRGLVDRLRRILPGLGRGRQVRRNRPDLMDRRGWSTRVRWRGCSGGLQRGRAARRWGWEGCVSRGYV